MITKLNLATHPFRNRNLPYILAILLLAGSVGAAVICFARLSQNSRADQLVAGQIKDMQADVDRLNGEGAKVQHQLTPEQQTLLIEAHKLVANKTFGWSRLFADLESVLPGGVSASRISVENIYRDGDRNKAVLDFAVLSHNYQAVTAMIDNMNNSGLFQAELRGQDLQKNESSTFTEYSLRLVYTPSYSSPAEPAADLAQTGGAQ